MDQTWFTPNQQAVISYVALRRSIGAIGIALPFVLALGALTFFDEGLRSSISSYYYSGMRDVLVGSMCAIGVFLLCYRFGRVDDLLGDVAGVSAIGLALFPTSPGSDPASAQSVVGTVHLGFATVFFLALAAFSLFLFTRTDPGAIPSGRKQTRNAVYRVCGWVIVGCLVLAVLTGFVLAPEVKNDLQPLFWLESIAVLAFGVSWTVKGWNSFPDPPPSPDTVQLDPMQMHASEGSRGSPRGGRAPLNQKLQVGSAPDGTRRKATSLPWSRSR